MVEFWSKRSGPTFSLSSTVMIAYSLSSVCPSVLDTFKNEVRRCRTMHRREYQFACLLHSDVFGWEDIGGLIGIFYTMGIVRSLGAVVRITCMPSVLSIARFVIFSGFYRLPTPIQYV